MAKLKVRALDNIGESFDLLSGILGQKMAEDRAYTRQKETERRKQDWYWKTLNEERAYNENMRMKALETYRTELDQLPKNESTGQPTPGAQFEALQRAGVYDPNILRLMPAAIDLATDTEIRSNTSTLWRRNNYTNEIYRSNDPNPMFTFTESGELEYKGAFYERENVTYNTDGEKISTDVETFRNPYAVPHRGGGGGGYKVAELFSDGTNMFKIAAIEMRREYDESTQYGGGYDKTWGEIIGVDSEGNKLPDDYSGTPTDKLQTMANSWDSLLNDYYEQTDQALDVYGTPLIKQVRNNFRENIELAQKQAYSKLTEDQQEAVGGWENVRLDANALRPVFEGTIGATLGDDVYLSVEEIPMLNAIFFMETYEDFIRGGDDDLNAMYYTEEKERTNMAQDYQDIIKMQRQLTEE